RPPRPRLPTTTARARFAAPTRTGPGAPRAASPSTVIPGATSRARSLAAATADSASSCAFSANALGIWARAPATRQSYALMTFRLSPRRAASFAAHATAALLGSEPSTPTTIMGGFMGLLLCPLLSLRVLLGQALPAGLL